MIRFGLQFPQITGSYEKIRDLFVDSEKLGFDSAWLMDHVYNSTGFIDPVLESFTTMAALARDTSKIRMGPLVACNTFRHPSLLAKMSSTLDVISSGRLELGIGAGWYSEEFESYGIPFPPFADRIGRLREAVVLIKRMWMEDNVTFQGKYYKVKDAYNNPKPIQKPHPPIWMGGKGDVALKIAIEHADYLNFYLTSLEEFKANVRKIRDYCEDLGIEIGKIRYTWYGRLYLTGNGDEAIKALKREKENSKHPLIINMSFKEFAQKSVFGTPEECLQKFQEFSDAGAGYFITSLWQADDPHLLETIYDEIVRPLKKGQ